MTLLAWSETTGERDGVLDALRGIARQVDVLELEAERREALVDDAANAVLRGRMA